MKLTAWEQFPYSVREAWKVMRLTTFFIFISALQLSAKSTAQKITLSSDGISMEQFFSQLKKQTGYSFLLEIGTVSPQQKIDVHVTKASLEEVLDQVLKPLSLSYSIDNRMVIIKKMALIPSLSVLDLPPFEINGHVTDSLGNPLAGASVTLKGSRTSVGTDIRGNFSMKADQDNIVLIISYTGYQTKTITVSKGENIKVVLSISNNILDQIQVIAYGTTSKRLNTGDVSTVTSQTIEEQPVTNPLAALEGRAPGLIITQTTGFSGGLFNVQIRGQNSIFNGNAPLYIIDGVPFTGTAINSQLVGAGINGGGSAFSNIDPSNIVSIDILKDADATAIYGTRGANGVILITTKKGKAGKSTFNLNAYTGVGEVTRTMPLLNTKQYLAMRHEAFANDGATPDPNTDFDLTTWDTTRNVNWEKVMIGNQAHFINAEASLSGGNANTQYMVGASYNRSTTVLPADFADQKIAGSISLNQTSSDRKFKLSFTGNYIIDNNNLPTTDPTSFANALPPDAPEPLTPDGKLNWANGTYTYNPYYFLFKPYQSNATNLISNLTLNYTILDGLEVKANMGYNRMQIDETAETPIASLNPAYGQTTGSTYFSSNAITSWIIEPQVEYKTQTKAGNFDFLAGLTFQENFTTGDIFSATGYTSDALLGNIGAAAQVTPYAITYAKYSYQSGFARINYNWKDKYIINLTGRRDGSSRFGPGNQFANFGAVGAAWLFTSEDWWKDLVPFISFGKLRASYGITGNDQIGDYQYLASWTPTVFPYQVAGLQPTQLANPDYGWETNKKSEIGMELGFLKDRILLSTSYFINRSSNQLILYTLAGITGFQYITQNSPATVQNSGVEFDLNITNVKGRDFSWRSEINLSIPKNELVSFPNLAESPYSDLWVIGKPLSISNSFHYTGVDPKTGLYVFDSKDPANPVYPDDLKAIKHTGPVYYGGFDNEFTYKNWHLDIFFQFVDQIFYNYLYYNFTQPGMLGNQPTYVLNRWQKPGDQASVEKYSQNYGDAYNAYLNVTTESDQQLGDASFIRLKNINFSYSFSGSWMKRMKMEGLSLYVSGQNLITITHYQGNDPENHSPYSLPPLKVLTVGFKCSF